MSKEYLHTFFLTDNQKKHVTKFIALEYPFDRLNLIPTEYKYHNSRKLDFRCELADIFFERIPAD